MVAIIACPHCFRLEKQVKAGMNSGNQRYKCLYCRRRYTPAPQSRGHSAEARAEALALHAKGLSSRQVAQATGISSRTVASWARKAREEAARPVEAPEPTVAKKRGPTIYDVAIAAGVSTATVSNYMNGKGRMSPETHDKVKAAIRELRFVPGATLSRGRRRTYVLGVLSFSLSLMDSGANSIVAPLLEGIKNGAEVAQQELLFYTAWPIHPDRYSELDFVNGPIDGLVWIAPTMQEPMLKRLAATGLPVVALLTRHVPPTVGYVNADNTSPIVALIRMLYNDGHRRIAYVGPAHSSNYLDRRNAYREGLTAVDLPYEPSLESSPKENIWNVATYRKAVRKWAASAAPPTAIVAADDGFARIVQAELIACAYSPMPALTGFNDDADADAPSLGLTTVRQPFQAIGRAGVEHLVAMIERTEPPPRVTLPAEVIVRSSTTSVSAKAHA